MHGDVPGRKTQIMGKHEEGHVELGCVCGATMKGGGSAAMVFALVDAWEKTHAGHREELGWRTPASRPDLELVPEQGAREGQRFHAPTCHWHDGPGVHACTCGLRQEEGRPENPEHGGDGDEGAGGAVGFRREPSVDGDVMICPHGRAMTERCPDCAKLGVTDQGRRRAGTVAAALERKKERGGYD